MVIFRIDESYLIGAWCASALWGGFTVLFGYCMYFIITTRKGERNKVTTAAVIVMYCLATAHISMVLKRLIEGFIVHQGDPGPLPGSEIYMGNIGVPINRAKDMVYITNMLIGDSIVVWRCFMVWNRSYIIIAGPLLLLFGTAVAGYGAIGSYFLPATYLETVVKWGTAMFAVSLTTNITVTLMTAGRIWWLTRSMSAVFSARSRYRNVLLLVIESGAVVALAKLIEFILFRATPHDGIIGNNALYIVFECMPQITGIVPTMIIVVVNMKVTATQTHVASSTMLPTSSISGGMRFAKGKTNQSTTLQDSTTFSLEPMSFVAPSATRTTQEDEDHKGTVNSYNAV